jgi:hypothetical protein
MKRVAGGEPDDNPLRTAVHNARPRRVISPGSLYICTRHPAPCPLPLLPRRYGVHVATQAHQATDFTARTASQPKTLPHKGRFAHASSAAQGASRV